MLYDLEPTNNHPERAMLFAGGHCNARIQACSLGGMRRRNML
jgi:hypothetical protein